MPEEEKKYSEPKRYTPFSAKKKREQFQPVGEPKPGRKVSKPKVKEEDELSSAHANEKFRKDNAERNNRGGRS